MEQFLDVLADAGVAFLTAVIPALLAWLGVSAKTWLAAQVDQSDDQRLEWAAGHIVRFVEQVYTDVTGEQKLETALDRFMTFATTNNLDITREEARAFIEAAVFEMNQLFLPPPADGGGDP